MERSSAVSYEQDFATERGELTTSPIRCTSAVADHCFETARSRPPHGCCVGGGVVDDSGGVGGAVGRGGPGGAAGGGGVGGVASPMSKVVMVRRAST